MEFVDTIQSSDWMPIRQLICATAHLSDEKRVNRFEEKKRQIKKDKKERKEGEEREGNTLLWLPRRKRARERKRGELCVRE